MSTEYVSLLNSHADEMEIVRIVFDASPEQIREAAERIDLLMKKTEDHRNGRLAALERAVFAEQQRDALLAAAKLILNAFAYRRGGAGVPEWYATTRAAVAAIEQHPKEECNEQRTSAV